MSKKGKIKENIKDSHRPPKKIHSRISIYYIVVAIVAFFLYTPSLQYPLDKLDEDFILQDNIEFLRNKGNLKEVLTRDAFFRKPGESFYRPVQNYSFYLNAQGKNVGPSSFRLTNLLLHIVICWLLLCMLSLFNVDPLLSFMFALLYTVHPLFVQAVIWTPARGDLLITFFTVLIFIVYLTYKQSNRSVLFVSFLYAVAVFSKETALLIPAVIFVYEYLHSKDKKQVIRKLFPLMLSLALVATVFLIVRSKMVFTGETTKTLGFAVFMYNLKVMPIFLSKFFFPIKLSMMPLYQKEFVFIGILLLIVLLYFVVKNRTQEYMNVFIWGFVWFLLFTFPVMIYRHAYYTKAYDYLETRSYLPMLGVVISLAVFFNTYKNIRRISIFLAIIAILFITKTSNYARLFKDNETFYGHVLKHNPGCAVAASNMANAFVKKGEYEKGKQYYDQALTYFPDFPEALNNRATCRGLLKDYSGAIEDYTLAIKYKNNYADAYKNRGTIKYTIRDYVGALVDYKKAIIYDPYNKAENYFNRGLGYLQNNKKDSACIDFKQAAARGYERATEALRVFCSK